MELASMRATSVTKQIQVLISRVNEIPSSRGCSSPCIRRYTWVKIFRSVTHIYLFILSPRNSQIWANILADWTCGGSIRRKSVSFRRVEDLCRPVRRIIGHRVPHSYHVLHDSQWSGGESSDLTGGSADRSGISDVGLIVSPRRAMPIITIFNQLGLLCKPKISIFMSISFEVLPIQ